MNEFGSPEDFARKHLREVPLPDGPPPGEDGYGRQDDQPPPRDEEPKPRIICPTVFMGQIPPPRFWIAEDWIPYGVVTGLYGDGGVGKSLIAQQLQTGTALGSTWLGLPVDRVASLGVYCEDDDKELWRRQHDINASYLADYDALSLKNWMPRLGENNILMAFPRNGVGELTPFHRHVVEAALDLGVRLVIIDTAADTFGGNENDRGQVRQFVQRALGQIAIKIRGALVCCAHPSRAGLSTGSGDSGSTGWNNAFRSRQYLFAPEAEGNEPPDPNARILERKKANYAARGNQIRLRWHNGVIVPDTVEEAGVTAMGRVDARAVFLSLVREMNEQNRPVSAKGQAPNYAPREFERLPNEQRYGFTRADFQRAMNALFRDGKIINVPYGRKGDERFRIAVSEE